MKARVQIVGVLTHDAENFLYKGDSKIQRGRFKIAINLNQKKMFLTCFLNYALSDSQLNNLKKGANIMVCGLYSDEYRNTIDNQYFNQIINVKTFRFLDAGIKNYFEISIYGFVWDVKELDDEYLEITIIEECYNSLSNDNPRRFQFRIKTSQKIKEDDIIYVQGNYDHSISRGIINRTIDVLDYEFIKESNSMSNMFSYTLSKK